MSRRPAAPTCNCTICSPSRRSNSPPRKSPHCACPVFSRRRRFFDAGLLGKDGLTARLAAFTEFVADGGFDLRLSRATVDRTLPQDGPRPDEAYFLTRQDGRVLIPSLWFPHPIVPVFIRREPAERPFARFFERLVIYCDSQLRA